jgi:hypothetical protein
MCLERLLIWNVSYLIYVLCLQFFENLLLCSYDDLIAYRFMLVLIMIISYQACLVCKWFSKSYPHNQFVLNYGLVTKLYIAKISRGDSKSEKSFLTRLVWSLHWTSRVPWVFNPTGHFLDHIWALLLPKFFQPAAKMTWRRSWGSTPKSCGFLGDPIPYPSRIWSPPDLL